MKEMLNTCLAELIKAEHPAEYGHDLDNSVLQLACELAACPETYQAIVDVLFGESAVPPYGSGKLPSGDYLDGYNPALLRELDAQDEKVEGFVE